MRGRGIIRVLIFFPYVISPIVAAVGFNLMLQQNGAINDLLHNLFGIRNGVNWLGSSHVAIWTLMAVLTWQYIGFAVILFLAGMQGIPEELSEAAAIDGASYWQIQRRITLPLLGPTIRIWAFLSIIGSIQVFDVVNGLWGDTLAQNSGVSTLATYMYHAGPISGRWGYGNAVAVVIFVISLIVALIYQRFVLRRDTEGALTGGAE
jgi:ABC-type sugar transport system permease subunit